MRHTCPKLHELPVPPAGRIGWPWTEGTRRLPATMPDGRPWPLVSIVTPSHNQGRYLEETIRSVLLQGYPHLEYIVIDGGSTDESVEIIRRYAGWLTYWESAPDRGQAHAINKGFDCATGDIVAWINSDDYYLPFALQAVAEGHAAQPTALVVGNVENFRDDTGDVALVRQSNISLRSLVLAKTERCVWHQPGIFAPRTHSLLAGPLDETLEYAFDYDWVCRLLQRAEVTYLNRVLVRFRVHASAKSTACQPRLMEETLAAMQRYSAIAGRTGLRHERAVARLQLASFSLAHHPAYSMFWNRGYGLKHLALAAANRPGLMLHPHFLRLLRRALVPRSFLRSSPWA